MNTADLEIFLCAAETLSFSQTAKRNYLSRQAVSRKIQSLEKELGTPLFIRAPQGQRMTLTAEGRQYYDFFLSCRHRWETLQRSLRAERREQSVQVAFLEGLDFPPDFQRILFDAVDRFGVSVEFHTYDMHNIGETLRDGKYDLVLAYEGPRLNLFRDYQRVPVGKIPMVLAVQKGLMPQAERASDLRNIPVATWLRKDQTAEEAVEKCARHCLDFGFVCTDVRVFPNRETARAAIESGHCVGLCTMLDRLAQSSGVTTIPLSGESSLTCLWPRDTGNPAVLSVVKTLDERAGAGESGE